MDVAAIKGNPPTPRAAVESAFGRACEAGFERVRSDGRVAVEDGHGRHDERYIAEIYDPAGLPAEWPEVAATPPGVSGAPAEAGGGSVLTRRVVGAGIAGRGRDATPELVEQYTRVDSNH